MADPILADKIKKARISMGLNLSEASKKLGFSNYQTLKSIEDGEREIKASELAIFSKVYYISLNHLLSSKNISDERKFLWRVSPSEKTKNQIEAKIIYRCELYNHLEQLLGLNEWRGIPIETRLEDISNFQNLTNLVEETGRMLNLGGRPAFELWKTLEQNYGIKILYESMPEGSAVSTCDKEFGAVIVINSTEVPWRRNYDLAHELFHILTWNTIPPKEISNSAVFNEIEKKAEKFASMILLPTNEITKEIHSRMIISEMLNYSDLIDMAMDFGVSAKAMVYRIASLRMLKWEAAERIAEDPQLSQISRHRRSKEKRPEPKSERMISLAIRCLRKGLISRGKFEEIVGIDRCDIDQFIEDSGLMVQEGPSVEIMAS